ncbi:glycosyltransferase family 2 protein [Dyella halodurans]|uniref:Glycosyltransferase family 2 protein n=1 Tax=Dyella halodurans TaxID=1920171 RepID=A0ABV9BZ78_9GAMM|nr:glycosyltransferase family 2 protein [Dyella halodurans]
MKREPLSVVVITYNNGGTLEACLTGVDWADEILVLDSGSTDDTVDIARRHGARVAVHPFDDFGPQKQRAYDMASHDWVLNLDADELLSPGTREVIEQALVAPRYAGFRLPRRERLFWTVQHRRGRRNGLLRLFDRRRGRMNDVEVHAAVEVDGPVKTLWRADFINDGDRDITTRMDKINRYTSSMVAHKLRRKQRYTGLRMVFYPPVYFLRQYLVKRYFLDGWAGFIASATGAFYAFLKYAKLHEAREQAARKDPH